MSNVPEPYEHDPQVATAWRDHSAEMPPPPLDAAILAAAHRAVASAPRDAAAMPREATSPQRWWMPLAAAATIGAIALGILQTAPHDEPATVPSVSDMPAGQDTIDKVAPAATAQREAEAAVAADAQRRSAPAPAESRPAVPPPPATTSAPPPPAIRGNFVAPPAQDKLTTMERKDSARAAPAPAAPLVAPPASPSVNVPGPGLDAGSQSTAPQPFPADKKAESTATMTPERARVAPAPAGAERDAMRNEAAPSAPTASGAAALGKTMARQNVVSARSVDIDASIVHIRKLHDEGKLADAAKELIALRAVAPDADSRLPPELRAWAATVKP